MAQKVVTVNIDTWVDPKVTNGFIERELVVVNKYLDEGYKIFDKITTVSNNPNANSINITFILSKTE